MRRTVLALATVLLLAGATLPAASSPQPTPVCGVCGGSFESALGGPVETATVTHSTATVRFHENGSATWHVRNVLANDSTAQYLADHPEALRSAVHEAMEYSTIDGPFESVSASVEGTTVHVTYRDPDAADAYPGGVTLTDYLHTHGYEEWPVLTVDRLTLVGPAGTTALNDPAQATVDGRNVTLSGDGSGRHYEAPNAPSDAYVVWGEPGGAGSLWGGLAVALATLPTVVDVLSSIHLPPLLLLALLLAGGARIGTAIDRRTTLTPRRLGGLCVALGLVAVLADVGTAGRGEVSAGMAFGSISLAMGGLAMVREHRTTIRALLIVGGVALAVIVAVQTVLSTGSEIALRSAFQQAVLGTSRYVPFVLAPVLGAAAGDRRSRLLAGVVVAAGFFVGELAVVWPTERPFGLVLLFLLAYAAVVAVAVLPFTLLGRAVARPAVVEADA